MILARILHESVLLVWVVLSHFVYLGVFDNLITVMEVKARPLGGMLQTGMGEMGHCKISNFKNQILGCQVSAKKHRS